MTGPGSGPPSGARALIVHSADDDADIPVPPILVEGDAQPSGLGRTLWSLLRRDGYEEVLAVLRRGGRWIRLSTETTDGQGAEGDAIVVPGYGICHPQDDTANLARTEDAMEEDQVWWYVVERHGMVIEVRQDHQRREVAFVRWDDPEPTWSALEEPLREPSRRS